MRPELDSVLQCLSLNGYSVFSLINDILAHGCDAEDRRIKSLREGLERDSVDICARLLNHNSSSASVYTWALSVAQSTLLPELEERTREERGLYITTSHSLSRVLPNRDVIPPGLSFGTASTPTNYPEELFSIGGAQFVKYRRVVAIDLLPDDVFLEIFDLCLRDPTKYPLQ